MKRLFAAIMQSQVVISKVLGMSEMFSLSEKSTEVQYS